MANFVFNIAKGRVAEYANRVDLGDPAASRLYLIPLLSAGLEAQSVLEDAADFAAVIAGPTDEATAGGWNRKTIPAADITAIAPDNTNNRMDVIVIDYTWTAVAAGNNSGALVFCYASVATPTNAQLVPLTHHDFAVTTDGTDITVDVPVTGFFRAT